MPVSFAIQAVGNSEAAASAAAADDSAMMGALLAAWQEAPVLAAPQALVAGWWAESVRLPVALRTQLAALPGRLCILAMWLAQILPQTQLAG